MIVIDPDRAFMKGIIIILLLLGLTALNSSHAQEVAVQSIVPTKSPAIHWEGRSHETIDGKIIAAAESITLANCSDIVISSCNLHSIHLANCQRITIGNCWIHGSVRCGVETYQCKEVLVQGCRLENLSSGVYAIESQGIKVIGNFCRNVKGPFPRGQMTQLNTVTGPGNVIRDNYTINEYRKSHSEDAINIYMSSGTAESPILIENNYLTGDPDHGNAGFSKSGSGIMLGDQGGAHEICRGNVVVAAGQAGIGVAGGDSITVQNNVIYGQKSNVANVGLYAWNQSGRPCAHITIAGNRVNWTDNKDQDASWWRGSGVNDLKLDKNIWPDASLPAAIPAPPTKAPHPPRPWTDGAKVARVPWKL